MINEQVWVNGWLFMVYNFKIRRVGAYRGMGSYQNEYGTAI